MWAIYSPRSKKNAIKVHKSTLLVFSQTAQIQLLVGALLTARKKICMEMWRRRPDTSTTSPG